MFENGCEHGCVDEGENEEANEADDANRHGNELRRRDSLAEE